MSRRADWVYGRQREAWAHGRAVCRSLLSDYCARYGLAVAPAPAVIIGELLTDFLDANLVFDPLPLSEFARTEWVHGKPFVTVNSLTGKIDGVKDAAGVQSVAAWHEAIHVVDHASVLQQGAQQTFLGFDVPQTIVCHRSPSRALPDEVRQREFWAEEAGRAAAVSYAALARSDSYRELCSLARQARGPTTQGFPLLYRAASDIGVNITALVKQLTLEGRIAVVGEGGRQLVQLQPALTTTLEEVA